MTASRPNNEAIFHTARDIPDPDLRREYVRAACGGDEARIAHVEALLAAADAPDTLLDRPAWSDPEAANDQPAAESTGTVIGPYKLIEQVGEGGMGTVFMAEQTHPVRRKVALKIIKPGMDTKQVIGRFEAERQALALMDHPNIARVLDAGATGEGRPYFAMELVKGIPITRYCDERRMSVRERLELFVPVCQAVQHAHQKGVIHRDLKPSNVLVAEYDPGAPGVPKVIDFGVAKATGQQLTEQTLHTGFGVVVGTPEYMSPEQAGFNQLDVDTRSDIYSLGVLLYELLAGSPPFTRQELERAGVLEMLRVIREREPTKPSTRLSTADGLPTLAANRGTEPSRLARLVRGELDWIVMKALEKDRNRRYETANGLAQDVQRYLADEVVSARPPSAGYRLRKFVRRNRMPLAAVAAAVLVALGGTATVLGVQTRANRDLRDANERTRRERDLARQNFDLARKAVDDYLTRVGQNPLLKEQGLHDLRHELLEAALGYYREFLAQRGEDPSLRADVAAAHERVGDILIELGRPGDALAAYDQALALIEPLVRERLDDPVLATAQVRLLAGRLQALVEAGSYSEAITAFDRARSVGEALLMAGGGTEHLPEILASIYYNATSISWATSRYEDALSASLRAQVLAERSVRDHPVSLSSARMLLRVSTNASDALAWNGRYNEARRLSEQGIAFGKAQVREHPRDVELRMYLARLELVLGELERSNGRLHEALNVTRSAADSLATLARENPLLMRARFVRASSLMDLSMVQTDVGQYAEAEQSARASIELFEGIDRDVPSRSVYRILAGLAHGILGRALLRAGSRGQALAMLRKSVTILETSDRVMDLSNMAWFLALASTIADPAEGPAAADRQRRDADRAVAMLRRAIAMGGAKVDDPKNNSDFDSLRSRPDFQALMMDLDFPEDPFSKDRDAGR